MPATTDRQVFKNEDLVLKVRTALDRTKFDDSRYEEFLDALCADREYQKQAIREAVRYLLGGEYSNLEQLARENYDRNPVLSQRYGSWEGMKRHLQLPQKLSASVDLATGTGKSYVMYGIAAILLAEGAVDRVLVLCPSTTIEAGLLEKFRQLAADTELRDLLPAGSKLTTPQIINARDSITSGTICVENYHAILEYVGSSIRDSLAGRGERVLVLNDEAHHVANESDVKVTRWKEFLLDPQFGFHYVIGVSGTCYVGDDYFSDVIFRYSLRKAMEENYVKKVEYVADMPLTGDPDEKWQVIRNHHEEARRKLKRHSLRPLTIIVTQSIARCKDVAEELKGFLIEVGCKPEEIDDQVLLVYNGAPGVARLARVDNPTSKVEWIVSVSMLNEGWDVKRVFQIVPHEERAFNSKLLISQVLGRGLRIPEGWRGEQPQVTVFNHHAWAERIKKLVNEVLEREKRLQSEVLDSSPFHFELLNIDYTLQTTTKKVPMDREYNLLSKGYVDLPTESVAEDVRIEFEHALNGEKYSWETRIQRQTYTAREIALEMYSRLEEAQDPDDADPRKRTIYTDQFPLEKLEGIVQESLRRAKAQQATEGHKQRFLQALGPLRRKASDNVRYSPVVNKYFAIPTVGRQLESASAIDLRATKTYFYTDNTRVTLNEDAVEFFDEVTEPGSGYKAVRVANPYDFKTPLNAVIADHEPEKRFINGLVRPENASHYDAWLKSTTTRFYEIEYAWKKGDHTKRGKFNPDLFVKAGNLILVIEIKDDDELRDPSPENKKKNDYALAHFKRINDHLEAEGNPVRYKFMFLTEASFNRFFQSLREGTVADFRSELDVKLAADD